MDWSDFAAKVGVPCVVLLALLYGILHACRWGAVRADRLIDSHVDFLSGLSKRDEAQTEYLRVLADETKRHREMVSSHIETCEMLSEAKRGIRSENP